MIFYSKFLNIKINISIKFIIKKENSCVYLKKNIEFCSMRLSVREMWATNGDSVTCGYVGDKTRVKNIIKIIDL